jgi:alkylation response protein AidB-like acyl-CoA dehydrogenase
VNFEFDAEQEALRATVRRFLRECAPVTYVRSMLDGERGTTDDVWRGLAALGATGLLVPEAHGGAGMGMVDMGVVLEELGRAVHPGPFLSSAVGAVCTVMEVGSDADRAALLPGLADGSVVAAVALADASFTVEADGRVSGRAGMVPDASASDLVLVPARSNEGAVGVYAVERTGEGVRVSRAGTVDGTRKHATVELERAPARPLGAAGADATEALTRVVDRVLIALVVDGLGAASVALDLAVEYAKQRVQFDRPIGSFQAVQHLCADMLQSLELGRSGAYYALWAADAAEPAECHRAAIMAKAFAGDAFARVGASAIQVFGGVGFTWEHDIHLFYKRLLTLQQTLGTSSDHLEELASIIM